VSVIDCPTGNPLLDNAGVRDSIHEQFKRTLYDQPQASRREQIAVIVEQAGHPENQIYIPLVEGPGTNGCSSYWNNAISGLPSALPAGAYYVVAFVHLHPTSPDEVITYPPCMHGGMPGFVKAAPGPSEPDWKSATTLSDALISAGYAKPGEAFIPSYAIDPGHAYGYLPHTPESQQSSNNPQFWMWSYNPLSPTGCP